MTQGAFSGHCERFIEPRGNLKYCFETFSTAPLSLVSPIKQRNNEMELSKLISLIIVAFYVIFLICFFVVKTEDDNLSGEEFFGCTFIMLFFLALSLGCIWWGDELGEGPTGARFGLISSPSPGWAVRMIGWIFIALPAIVFFLYWIGGHLSKN